ncbi:Sodium/glucose cotransporter 1 [Bulinus truncatus]|nr:Sodium/glucose cotransporter 1 [Bulinus truncatus]
MESAPGLNHWGDILIVTLYFIAVLLVGLWSLCRPNRGSIKSYFLAGRDLTWWPVGASLFSSNIGSEHFVGLTGTGAAAGIAMVLYEWNSMFLVIVLAWFFLPVYVSAGVYTLPEYMAKRFGGTRLRVYLSCLSLILYIVTKLAVSIYSGGLFIKLALGWGMYISIAGLLLITGLYTVLGGLAAVIYTDTFQTCVMTVGAIVLSIISFNKIGGYKQLVHSCMMAVPSVTSNVSSSCGRPREDAFHLFRDPVNCDNPWPGILLQSSIGCYSSEVTCSKEFKSCESRVHIGRLFEVDSFVLYGVSRNDKQGVVPSGEKEREDKRCVKSRLLLAIDRGDHKTTYSIIATKVPTSTDSGHQLFNQGLVRAALTGDENMVSFLLTEGADINYIQDNGITPLKAAIVADSYTTVETLLRCGAKSQIFSTHKVDSPLHLALKGGFISNPVHISDRWNAKFLTDTKIIKLLIDNGMSVT